MQGSSRSCERRLWGRAELGSGRAERRPSRPSGMRSPQRTTGCRAVAQIRRLTRASQRALRLAQTYVLPPTLVADRPERGRATSAAISRRCTSVRSDLRVRDQTRRTSACRKRVRVPPRSQRDVRRTLADAAIAAAILSKGAGVRSSAVDARGGFTWSPSRPSRGSRAQPSWIQRKMSGLRTRSHLRHTAAGLDPQVPSSHRTQLTRLRRFSRCGYAALEPTRLPQRIRSSRRGG